MKYYLNNRFFFSIYFFAILVTLHACKDKIDDKTTTPYELVRPYKFPVFPNQDNMDLTEEAIELGRRLFYDPILSGDSTMSCATCHKQAEGFSDSRTFSIGIGGTIGKRQAMPIMNLVWESNFFWDGRKTSLEAQALAPVEDPTEMKAHWPIVVEKIQKNSLYIDLFKKAFPNETITKELVAKAIAQFEKTLVSANTKFDLVLKGQYTYSEAEQRGYDLFFSEQADCFHCHSGNLMTDLQFHNNGLDATHTDKGLEEITNNINDRGKFKTPSLRNIFLTAPYMHDGRFATIDEVLDFYSTGVQSSASLDPLMEFSAQGGVTLNEQEKADLKAFLMLLTDESFTTNPDFASPF